MAKRLCVYGIFSALCIALGFAERLISFDFIAPGIKLGLANAVVLLLIRFGDVKGAFAVNAVRILLSGLLFSAPSVLIYSLSGGLVSTAVMTLVSKCKRLGVVGFSILGAVTHNITQLLCAWILLGRGVLYYSPFLLLAALLSGSLTGVLAGIVSKRLKYNKIMPDTKG